jgi:nucleoside-diphosphate-sugar epimerase
MLKEVILITGGKGRLGLALKKKIDKKKFKVLNPSSKKLNLLNPKKIKKYFKQNKIQIIIHCAWQINNNNILKEEIVNERNYKMSKNIIKISKKNKVRFFLNISSVNAYYFSKKKLSEKDLFKTSDYLSKKKHKDYAKKKIVKLINNIPKIFFVYRSLLLSNIIGGKTKLKNELLFDKIIRSFNSKKRIIFKVNLRQIINVIHISDAVDAIIFFLNKMLEFKLQEPHINICSKKSYKIKEILNKIKKKYKKKIYILEHDNFDGRGNLYSCALANKLGWQASKRIF